MPKNHCCLKKKCIFIFQKRYLGPVGGGGVLIEKKAPMTDTDPLVLDVFVYICTSMERWLRLVALLSLSSGGTFQNVCQENFLSL